MTPLQYARNNLRVHETDRISARQEKDLSSAVIKRAEISVF